MVMSYIDLDFCIIENPLDKSKRPIIFVTRKGWQHLDETVISEDDYEKAIFAIQDLGYVESDTLTFESSQDPDFPSIDVMQIKKVLENSGMRYSSDLEFTLKQEFESYSLSMSNSVLNNYPKSNLVKSAFLSPYTKGKYKIPEIGERLTLYFYLFMECNFSAGKCYLNLNGDFASKTNTDMRNLLTPFKCDFVRINNIYNPNKIILKSCHTNQDIIKKLPVDFGGSFRIKVKDEDKVIEKSFVYYLMEVKNNLPLENRITIEVDSSYNFDQMIIMSKKAKEDYISLFKRYQYGLGHLPERFKTLSKILKQKMLEHAQEEEYEKAGKVKKDIDYINEALSKLDNELKDVPTMVYCDYIKSFHVN